MEFKEFQEVWDSQGASPAFTINEKALHETILSKMRRAEHTTQVSELISVIVNFGSGLFIFGINLSKPPQSVALDLLGAWMLATGVYALVNRIRRIKGSRRFDRSIRGDLEHALLITAYHSRFSKLMRLNIFPIALFVFLGFWERDKPLWIGACMAVVMSFAWWMSGKEQNVYKKRSAELDLLKQQLGA